jgi:osmoprotectant transport system permease protein
VGPAQARVVNAIQDLFVWFNDPANWEGSNGVPRRVFELLWVWAWAMTIAVLIAVPGGLLLGRTKRSGVLTANVANVGRAIPTFAVLVLGVIWFGLGNLPVILALVLLAIPPMFTFTLTAIRQVDPATVESARGMGMTEGRILRTVQVPLALPLMLNGVRLSSAAVIATAPLAALVAGGGLGRYVVDGFAVRDYTLVRAGVVLVIALVLVNELVFAGLIRAASTDGSTGPTRRRRRVRRDAFLNT